MSTQKLGYHLERTDVDGDSVVACRHCEERICGAAENYKEHVLCERMPMEEGGPLMNDPAEYVDDEMEFRKYYCPGCGTLLENEVILADLDPVHDRELR